MKKNFFFLVFFLFFFLFSKKIFAQLRINEIYPAPTTGEYEWVELYNNSPQEIDLDLFVLHDLANNKIVINEKKILPFSFVLATSSSCLNNSNQPGKDFADVVFLKNINNEIIDIATYSGIFTPEKTFARCPDGEGQWFVLNYPTKNQSNHSACLILTPSYYIVSPTPTLPITLFPTITYSFTPTPTSYEENIFLYDETILRKIYLSEAMVYPESQEKEWIEIYNDNETMVILNNWFIDDIENGGSSLKSFSLEIPPKGFGVVELSTHIFNNTGDSVRLLDNQKILRDSFEYQNSQKGKSLGRYSLESDEFCLQEPSKGQPNHPCLLTITFTPTISPAQTFSSFNLKTSSQTISLAQTNKNNSKLLPNQASKNNFIFKNPSTNFKVSSFSFLQKQKTTEGEVLGTTTENHSLKNFSSSFALGSFLVSFLNFIFLVKRIGERIPL